MARPLGRDLQAVLAGELHDRDDVLLVRGQCDQLGRLLDGEVVGLTGRVPAGLAGCEHRAAHAISQPAQVVASLEGAHRGSSLWFGGVVRRVAAHAGADEVVERRDQAQPAGEGRLAVVAHDMAAEAVVTLPQFEREVDRRCVHGAQTRVCRRRPHRGRPQT